MQNVRRFLVPTLLCAFAILAWARGAQAQPLPIPQFPENHYKCYEIFESEPFDSREVTLKDQFGFTKTKVVRPRYLCNPVSKNGEPVPEPDVHQVCYQIFDNVDLGEFKVLVSNQFGELTIKVHRPEWLCVPSKKSHL